MKEDLKFLGFTLVSLVVVYLVVDFFGFWLWVFSGQIPTTEFYFGKITTEVVKSIFIK